ncbi:MAG TPA: hypothetical protein VK325_11280 [Pseudoxanthomonas sp.]|nr:hypothetical protein [Pseudoxanthomonas sp.]
MSYEWLTTGRGRITQLPEIEAPAVDADMVWDPTERRLLRAFRENPPEIKLLVLQMAESHAPKAASCLDRPGPWIRASDDRRAGRVVAAEVGVRQQRDLRLDAEQLENASGTAPIVQEITYVDADPTTEDNGQQGVLSIISGAGGANGKHYIGQYQHDGR